jgi:hypothetical protein
MDDGHHLVDVSDWSDAAETLLLRRETRATVHQAMAQLPHSYREVLQLRDMEELSTAEAAAALGISEAAVKIRLHRARQALRSLIERALERPRVAPAAAPDLTARPAAPQRTRHRSGSRLAAEAACASPFRLADAPR